MLQESLDVGELAHADSPLSAKGEKQLNFKLSTKPKHFQEAAPQKVICSPLKRTVLTALAAYPEHDIVVDPNLREIGCQTGLLKFELKSFIAGSSPDRKASVDISRVPEGPWWTSTESTEEVDKRLQKILKEVQLLTGKKNSRAVALVAHYSVFRTMVGDLRPFPHEWGCARGWPRNFKPYVGKVIKDLESKRRSRVVPQSVAVGPQVILLRHAHSRAQEANTLMKKLMKFDAGSNKCELMTK